GGAHRRRALTPASTAAVETYLLHRAAAQGVAVEQLTGPLFVTATGGRADRHALFPPIPPPPPPARLAAPPQPPPHSLPPPLPRARGGGGPGGGGAGRVGPPRPPPPPPLRPGPAQPRPRSVVRHLVRPGPPPHRVRDLVAAEVLDELLVPRQQRQHGEHADR